MIEYFNEDCMVGMARYPDKHFDLAIVDPPYRERSQNDGTATMRAKNEGESRKDMFGDKPNADYFEELFRVSKNQIIWGGNNFIDFLCNTNCMIFWYKQNPMPNYSDGEFAWTSFRSISKCLNLPHFGAHTSDKNKIHPTQKPVALYKWLLTNYAKPGDLILDTHVGSASSLIACHDMGFDAVGFELDPDYYRTSKQRLDDFMRQPRLDTLLQTDYEQQELR